MDFWSKRSGLPDDSTHKIAGVEANFCDYGSNVNNFP